MQQAIAEADIATVAPIAEPTEIYGQTVADARELLKRAREVCLHYPVAERAFYTDIVFISRKVFAKAIKWKKPTDEMPCELRQFGEGAADMKLVIGGAGALMDKRYRQEARDAARP